jgi:8-oxo-dGTP diphosphatase
VERFRVVPAAYVVLRRADQVLLIRRANTGFMDGYWAVVAGHVEQGESVHAAAVREAREEVGVTVAPGDLTPLCCMHRTGGNGQWIDERADFFFATTRWTGEPARLEPDKTSDIGWFPLDALPDPVVPHELVVLDALRKAEVPPILTFGFP